MNKLIIICGISFAGKSTLAKSLSEKFGFSEIDVDEVKLKIFGNNVNDDDLTSQDWDKLYKETDKLIEEHLKSGKTVIDASRNFKKAERQRLRKIANLLDIEVITIFVNTPSDIAWERWNANKKNQTRRNVTEKDFEDTLKMMEEPEADEKPLIFSGMENINSWIVNNIKLNDIIS